MNTNKTILLTVDVEDWFQVENFKNWIRFENWSDYELRVEKNTHAILDLLDSFSFKRQTGENDKFESPRATFFTMGWIADRLPHLVREIDSRGHEIASHGYNHDLCTKLSRRHLETDFIESKKLLEDVTGKPVYGFRAPSFAIDNHILKLIRKCGYCYDSSYNTFGYHDRYGKLDIENFRKMGISYQISDNFFELPVNNYKNGKIVIPVGGGGYFRLIPLPIFRFFVRLILRRDDAYMFYMHPWEIDFRQPRLREAGKSFKFRHYVNIRRTESKLRRFVDSFSGVRFMTCHDYLKQISATSKTEKSANR